jgi:predicted transcriptional regulator
MQSTSDNNNETKSLFAEYKDLADDAVALQILESIDSSPQVTQRIIKYKTGLATGLVHSYMRHVISKGWVRAKQVSAKRWLYFLTPDGFLEKSRLSVNYMARTFSEYRQAQNKIKQVLDDAVQKKWLQLAVAGTGDFAAIAVLNIQAYKELELVGVLTQDETNKLTDVPTYRFEQAEEIKCDRIFVCDPLFLKWWGKKEKDLNDPRLINLSASVRS